MLLQVPEQRDLVENEVRVHGMIKHRSVIRLIQSEIKGNRVGADGMAYLLFPYYKVTLGVCVCAVRTVCSCVDNDLF